MWPMLVVTPYHSLLKRNNAEVASFQVSPLREPTWECGLAQGISLNEDNSIRDVKLFTTWPMVLVWIVILLYSIQRTQTHHFLNWEPMAVASVRWIVHLNTFKNTILAMDLDQYFGSQSVFLNVIWEPTERQAFTNSTALWITMLATLLTFLKVMGDWRVYLNIAVETNPVAQSVALVL
jgi:hypothetical protein